MGFVMSAQWRSKKNYINQHFLENGEIAEWTKTVKLKYKVIEFPIDNKNNVRVNGFSFFCDNLLIYAEIEQDCFILGLNNHTYLEFKRADSIKAIDGDQKPNRFQLMGVRPLDSLDQSQIIWLQGQSPFQMVDL